MIPRGPFQLLPACDSVEQCSIQGFVWLEQSTTHGPSPCLPYFAHAANSIISSLSPFLVTYSQGNEVNKLLLLVPKPLSTECGERHHRASFASSQQSGAAGTSGATAAISAAPLFLALQTLGSSLRLRFLSSAFHTRLFIAWGDKKPVRNAML